MTTIEPWAAFYASPGDLPFELAPPALQQLARMEAVERAEEVERRERIEEHREAAYNLAIAESMSRAHAAGEAWDPAEPLKHYPTREERIAQGFALGDAWAAGAERQARREAQAVLRELGFSGQVMFNVDPASSGPGETAGGDTGPPPASRAGVQARIRRALARMPRTTARDAHPLAAGADGWVPDHRDPDTGDIVRFDRRPR